MNPVWAIRSAYRMTQQELARAAGRSPDLLTVDSQMGGLNVHPAIQQQLVNTGITAWRERA